MNRKILVLFVIGAVALSACRNRNRNLAKAEEDNWELSETIIEVEEPKLCDEADGYVWSNMEQRCIRPHVHGIAVTAPGDETLKKTAYIHFNSDSTKAELFLPDGDRAPLLDRRPLADGSHAWNVEDDDTYNVRQDNGTWLVDRRGTPVYRLHERAQPIHTKFRGSDGKSRMMYNVDVAFYPARQAAVVTEGDIVNHLTQYETGSGYGYKNNNVDLRGKGNEATLTYTDGKVLTLVEDK